MNAPALLTTAEIRALEERAAKAVAGPTLMQRAGLATASAARDLARDTGEPILVVAGPGNNGGDAWVAAEHLREWFHRVVVLDVAGKEPGAPEAREALARYRRAGGTVVREWPAALRPSLVVDGLFGIGLGRELEGDTARLVQRINATPAPILAIDVPSGIASDTGTARGVAVRATRTITFIARKAGLHTGDALDHTGEIVLDDLGIDPAMLTGWPGSLVTVESLQGTLRPRSRNTHKGSFGTLGIVGGSAGMTGAAILAGRAGLLAGAGKVFVGLLAAEAPSFDTAFPELMLRTAEATLAADVLVVGPGAGHAREDEPPSAFERTVLPALLSLPKALVLDADALNAIAASDMLRDALAHNRRAPTILTPHPAEAARLLDCTPAEVQADRLAAAQALAQKFGAEIVLKGAGSVFASPDGTWGVNATGNPALASGGTGDVLAGLIGALLCQGIPAREALRLGVAVHGAAADSLVERGVGPAGVTASEIALEARTLLNRWARG